MYTEQKPLFTLSVAEFMAIVRSMVITTIEEREKKFKPEEKSPDQEFTIEELRKFLRCSKASVHNYKKLGMPFYRVGRTILFKKSEVMDFMKTLKRKKL